ncbi:CRS2-like protein, chloroplastic isoform X1 [Triticum dicoccoides]|uniref:CRS2-like protein, chloroplastic isoform X1 n=1 Tax=Triticum dicoccoides TaxID=85692 RepID=UPI000E7C9A4C|nr:CRS2-like protein, chloroplastic isoform X1 [Triticum dicoccoides]
MRGKLWVRFAPFLSKRYVSSSSSPSCSAIQPWFFVGLGNPGEKYQSTRHNVGFDMIDAFAESQNISLTKNHFKALFGEGMVDGVPVLLAKPQTYINLSGESAGALAAYYKLPLHRVVVAYDDTDLPCGVLRLQPKGGYGRHNGLKSVIYHFRKNREFGRLRIVGIGRPPGQMDPKAFVLQKFNKTGRELIDSAIKEGADILKMVVSKGLTEAARVANVDQKYKHLVSHDQQLL